MSLNFKIKESKYYRYWTDSEVNYLLDNYLTSTRRDIALHLGRSIEGVRSKLKKMCIVQDRRFYSSKEISIIKKHAGHYHAKHIAFLINRSLLSLYQFARKNGISLKVYGDSNFATKYSDEDIDFIRLLYDDGFSLDEIYSKFDHIPYYRIRIICCAIPDSRIYRHVSSDYYLKHLD